MTTYKSTCHIHFFIIYSRISWTIIFAVRTSCVYHSCVGSKLGFVDLIFNSLSEGANGDGMAVISSLRSFDREQQKEYLIPIVIKDSGNPAMTGTSTLTVIIRDVNDNKMQPGSKEIFAYNYMVIHKLVSKSERSCCVSVKYVILYVESFH